MLGLSIGIQNSVFDYDSLPISFQSGITFSLVALTKQHFLVLKRNYSTLERFL